MCKRVSCHACSSAQCFMKHGVAGIRTRLERAPLALCWPRRLHILAGPAGPPAALDSTAAARHPLAVVAVHAAVAGSRRLLLSGSARHPTGSACGCRLLLPLLIRVLKEGSNGAPLLLLKCCLPSRPRPCLCGCVRPCRLGDCRHSCLQGHGRRACTCSCRHGKASVVPTQLLPAPGALAGRTHAAKAWGQLRVRRAARLGRETASCRRRGLKPFLTAGPPLRGLALLRLLCLLC